MIVHLTADEVIAICDVIVRYLDAGLPLSKKEEEDLLSMQLKLKSSMQVLNFLHGKE